jgi:hypothetical protein
MVENIRRIFCDVKITEIQISLSTNKVVLEHSHLSVVFVCLSIVTIELIKPENPKIFAS